MNQKDLTVRLSNSTGPDDDDKFRGSYERFLLLTALGLKGLAGDGTTKLDKILRQLFAGLPDLPVEVNKDDVTIKRRNEAIEKLLNLFGFTEEFKENVIAANPGANESLFRALLVLKTTKLFADRYSGSGCSLHMKKITACAKVLELPDKGGDYK